MNFDGKTTIITGATSGIGLGIARALGDLNANLVLGGRNIEKGQDLAATLGARACFVGGDVKQAATNELLVTEAIARYGRLDYLVLSAGQLGIGKLDELSLDDWHDTIATNLHAVFYLLKFGIPEIRKSGGGSIVIIGSVAALHAFPNHPAYTASKGALPALVKQVARDYGPEIRINLISPAQVLTPLLEDSVQAFENPEAILDDTAQMLPLKRLGEPKDIAETVVHLLSDRASWITGANFIVDGGFLAT